MAKTKTMLRATPTDGGPPKKVRKRVAARGTRKRLFPDGDYLVLEVIPDDHESLPAGALIQLAGVPRFRTVVGAVKWIKQQPDDALTGKQILVVRAWEQMHIEIRTKQFVDVRRRPRVIYDPTDSEVES